MKYCSYLIEILSHCFFASLEKKFVTGNFFFYLHDKDVSVKVTEPTHTLKAEVQDG